MGNISKSTQKFLISDIQFKKMHFLIITFVSLEVFSTIGIDVSSFVQYILYALLPFCSKDLSIISNSATLKTMPARETEIMLDGFGAIVIFLSGITF